MDFTAAARQLRTTDLQCSVITASTHGTHNWPALIVSGCAIEARSGNLCVKKNLRVFGQLEKMVGSFCM